MSTATAEPAAFLDEQVFEELAPRCEFTHRAARCPRAAEWVLRVSCRCAGPVPALGCEYARRSLTAGRGACDEWHPLHLAAGPELLR